MRWTCDPPQICGKCRRFHNRLTASGRWPAVITVCPQCDRSGKTTSMRVSPNDLGLVITYTRRAS